MFRGLKIVRHGDRSPVAVEGYSSVLATGFSLRPWILRQSLLPLCIRRTNGREKLDGAGIGEGGSWVEGHFARECPSKAGGNAVNNGGQSSFSAPSTPRFWTPRRNPVEDEEKGFLRELITERKEEKARKRELKEQKRFDERLRVELAKYAEATKADVMAAVGRQYLGQKEEVRREEVRREEQRRGWSPPPRRRREFVERDEGDMEVDDLDEEIRRLSALREKRRKGKEPNWLGGNFRQPLFSAPNGGEDTPLRAECSWCPEGVARTKIPAGSGPERLMEYVLEQKKRLSAMHQDELKRICSKESLLYCIKGPSIDRIVAARTKLAYEGFIFSPATSAPGSPEVDLAD
ncbi:hypothetical protein CBR_g21288 [Chara braunii]|uniref:Uncharacterized protein n=1 Tax=Chara braunii TaxID=69332 RepID=A0A388L1C0_CHABU|nr:hypothetical protein CBR_g21288 [Chara braunii]|eukprot:GBG76048.1 hypothetical protein CBR_g21288 [Chara braunii]